MVIGLLILLFWNKLQNMQEIGLMHHLLSRGRFDESTLPPKSREYAEMTLAMICLPGCAGLPSIFIKDKMTPSQYRKPNHA